ncbi:MAG: hypothetical protein Kow0060_03230 [Methylohalobius crimeensis]|uniref:type I-E CRISPR-associated protein Cse2/CasB n=1 Tax=Methylohalobius crimeensis TaxID=244365 RepID=UPI0003B7461B|nr:type I-E CRISPR-associated protein Cse2/CasB [Methylohalobius crimeensis]
MIQPQVSDTAPKSHELYHTIAHIAGVIGASGFPTGERASLRRMTPDQSPSIYFYRFALRHLPESWEFQIADWQTLVAGMALMSPAIHRPRYGYGSALAENNYSEARLERLLEARGDVRRILFLRAIRFLASKATPFDWTDAARLLLTRNEIKQDQIHARIAKDFYTNLDNKDKQST